MDTKYQIFVSSTFVDLKEERRVVLSAVQDMGDIPSGMEMFPATDEEQFNFIKRIIDNCDYYVVIIAGKYGSLAPDGLSYTEKEYDYAVSKGIHVLAFVRNEDAIEKENQEQDAEKKLKLEKFKAKVQTGRVVKPWNNKQDLVYSVVISLNQEKTAYPAIGWIRANQALSNENLIELNELRKEVDELRKYKQQQETKVAYEDIADFDDEITLHFIQSYWESRLRQECHGNHSKTISWRMLFAQIAPTIMKNPSEESMKSQLGGMYKSKFNLTVGKVEIVEEDFETIKLQLIAYGLIEVKYLQTISNSMAWFWNLTPKGEQEMMSSRIVRKKGQ